MRLGNITQTVWKRSVLKQMDTRTGESLIPPSAEEHCSGLTISEGNAVLHAHATATGNAASMGAFAAVRGINDLAVHGAKPETLSVQILLAPSNEETELRSLTKKLEEVCVLAKVQLACVTVQVNPAVVRPVVFATAYGQVEKRGIMGSQGAAPGQDIVLCGYAGLEGMLHILDEHYTELCTRFPPAFMNQAQSMRSSLLALQAIYGARKVGVTAMMQVGSGGIFGGLWELAEASHIGMEVELGKMSIRQETIEICEHYQLNPYQITSAGAILMTTYDGDELVRALKEAGARASRLGISTDKKDRVILGGQEVRYLEKPAQDELIRWWAKYEK